MSLSPVSAIVDMVAPVVLITLATIFANGLLTTLVAMGERITALNREHLDILRGPNGEVLDEHSLPPVDRERLRQIKNQMPAFIKRALRLRNAILVLWTAVGLLMLSVAAIAVAVTARSEVFAFAALALVIAGVGGVFAGIAVVIVPLAWLGTPLVEEARRTEALG